MSSQHGEHRTWQTILTAIQQKNFNQALTLLPLLPDEDINFEDNEENTLLFHVLNHLDSGSSHSRELISALLARGANILRCISLIEKYPLLSKHLLQTSPLSAANFGISARSLAHLPTKSYNLVTRDPAWLEFIKDPAANPLPQALFQALLNSLFSDHLGILIADGVNSLRQLSRLAVIQHKNHPMIAQRITSLLSRDLQEYVGQYMVFSDMEKSLRENRILQNRVLGSIDATGAKIEARVQSDPFDIIPDTPERVERSAHLKGLYDCLLLISLTVLIGLLIISKLTTAMRNIGPETIDLFICLSGISAVLSCCARTMVQYSCLQLPQEHQRLQNESLTLDAVRESLINTEITDETAELSILFQQDRRSSAEHHSFSHQRSTKLFFSPPTKPTKNMRLQELEAGDPIPDLRLQ